MEDDMLDGFEKALSDIQEERELREFLDDEGKLWLDTKLTVGSQRSELMINSNLLNLLNKKKLRS
jgi:hypothetical protein